MIEDGPGGHSCALPKPTPRERRNDLAFAEQRPVATVAIALTDGTNGPRRYFAASAERTWSGTVVADTPESAVIDIILTIRAECTELGRARFVPQLPRRSTLWRHSAEIGALFPDTFVEHAETADQDLLRTASTALHDVPAFTSSISPRPAVDGSPIWVATDGSVRGKISGWGWLASSGEYDHSGFRHSRKQIGSSVVLVSELRAIGHAVWHLHGRPITLFCDSKPAVAMVKEWMAGQATLPHGYSTARGDGKEAGLVSFRRMIHEYRDHLEPVWAPGHCGEPLNEGADALARLASRYASSDSNLSSDEYQRRAAGIAEAFSNEFNRTLAARRPAAPGEITRHRRSSPAPEAPRLRVRTR